MLSDAQLTPPGEAACVGEQVVFVCQQSGSTLTWTVDLPGGVSNDLVNSASSSQAGTVLTFADDPGFGFEIHVLSSSSASIISELRVTAVRELNGVTVRCLGGSGSFMSTIQIVSVGECTLYSTLNQHVYIYIYYAQKFELNFFNLNDVTCICTRSTSCSKWSDDNC